MDRLLNDQSRLVNANQVPYVAFKALEAFDFIRHGFSTKLGGVSEGYFSSMNLSYERGEDRGKVDTNYQRISQSIGFDMDTIVCTNQWHTVNVRKVDETNCGEGISRPKTPLEIDGQITDRPGVTLLVYGADCSPIYLVDPVHRAIGLSHSGWKGTLHNISLKTLEAMQEAYSTDPSEVTALIGPSICGSCYEIGEDVAEPFRTSYEAEVLQRILKPGPAQGKYFLDIWEANRVNLLAAGLQADNIYLSGLCTKCRQDLFYSHRRDGAARGTMVGFLQLKP